MPSHERLEWKLGVRFSCKYVWNHIYYIGLESERNKVDTGSNAGIHAGILPSLEIFTPWFPKTRWPVPVPESHPTSPHPLIIGICFCTWISRHNDHQGPAVSRVAMPFFSNHTQGVHLCFYQVYFLFVVRFWMHSNWCILCFLDCTKYFT